MIDIKELEHLAPMANEMLSGLHADEAMKRRILFAANRKKQTARPNAAPRARALLRGAGDRLRERFAPRLSGTAVDAAATPMPVSIHSIAAGGEQAAPMTRMADVSGTARARRRRRQRIPFRLGERRYSAGRRQRRSLSHAQRTRKRARRPAGQRGRHGQHGDRRALPRG